MSRTGLPLMRPIFLEYPQADNFYDENDEYLFGRDLLVSPVLTEMVGEHEVHLPPGEWYDYWDGSKHAAVEKIKSHLELDQMPLYVRAGAILPEEPLVQNTTETPNGPLELRVYPGSDCSGSLYLDDGHTYAYQKGGFVRIGYSCQVSENSVSVSSTAWQGSYQPWWTNIKLEVFGAEHEPKEVREGDHVVNGWRFDGENHSVTFTLTDSHAGWTVSVTY
jgi:alpha-glucosidase